LSKAKSELAEIKQMLKAIQAGQSQIQSGVRKLEDRLQKVEARQDRLEYHLENTVSGNKKISPAMEETLSALHELAELGHWVSVPELSTRTKRSVPTEEAKLKRLYELGIIHRQADYFHSQTGRRLRKFVYKPK
jgi:predicted transcriptional regulator